MEDRVLDPADVLVDRQPVLRGLCVDGLRGTRRAEACEVPRAVDKGVHGVRLARRLLAASGAPDMFPRRMARERVARQVEGDVLGQLDGQLIFWHRHNATVLAMGDG